jgi:hypothetical protein
MRVMNSPSLTVSDTSLTASIRPPSTSKHLETRSKAMISRPNGSESVSSAFAPGGFGAPSTIVALASPCRAVSQWRCGRL